MWRELFRDNKTHGRGDVEETREWALIENARRWAKKLGFESWVALSLKRGLL